MSDYFYFSIILWIFSQVGCVYAEDSISEEYSKRQKALVSDLARDWNDKAKFGDFGDWERFCQLLDDGWEPKSSLEKAYTTYMLENSVFVNDFPCLGGFSRVAKIYNVTDKFFIYTVALHADSETVESIYGKMCLGFVKHRYPSIYKAAERNSKERFLALVDCDS
ncbi:hypothetical protein [Microbulbifer halophilus]|uniref:DUF4019 domain-containing protein n=1 Tax=Microbulbifer halophilus TaxID=453963 RepID=A0ABW5EDP2_9GAMM|nr:hypothetical protein [Microbulbifer halophilus]MCW8126989.1 hypothetical protein [Microbulbifer halophilus]